MGFSPVKRVREHRYPTTIRGQLNDVLRDAVQLPPVTSTPYLTVSLDWRPSGADPDYRAAIQRFEQEARRIQHEFWPRGEVYDSLGLDILRIRSWLTNDVDPATRGLFVASNSGQDVFETVTTGIPLQNRISAGPVPHLLPLARLDEDHPTYAVLLADQQQAYLSLISQAHCVEQLTMISSDYPRKQATGGWSQRRFQQRADERLMALGRQISEEAIRYLELHEVEMLVIAGDEVITGTLDRTMPENLQRRVIARIRLDINATSQDILDATLPLAEQAEAERERASVQAVADAYRSGGNAVVGSNAVMDALVQGRVAVLVLNEDFHEDGWADFANHRYGVGDERHVFDTATNAFEAVPISVEEEMVRLAIQQNAEVDVILAKVPISGERDDQVPDADEIPRSRAARMLDDLHGVAALLRY